MNPFVEKVFQMTSELDFYWDLGSTNSYFALKLLEPLAKTYGAKINWHPFNVGYVFRSNNYVLMDEAKEKLDNRGHDLMRWAKKYELPFRLPSVFPIKTSRALRGAIGMRKWDKEAEFIRAIFAAYWEQDDGTIGSDETLQQIAETLGVSADDYQSEADSTAVRDALIAATNNARDRGVFGVPSIVVNNQLFWGKDRMEFVEDELSGQQKFRIAE